MNMVLDYIQLNDLSNQDDLTFYAFKPVTAKLARHEQGRETQKDDQSLNTYFPFAFFFADVAHDLNNLKNVSNHRHYRKLSENHFDHLRLFDFKVLVRVPKALHPLQVGS